MNRQIFFIGLVFILGCRSSMNAETKQFVNHDYGFFLSYPSGWIENTESLPQKWAIVDKEQNAILVVIDDHSQNMTLQDWMNNQVMMDLNVREIDNVNSVIKRIDIDKREWLSYAIDYSAKDTKALVSATLCNATIINIVLVSKNNVFEANKQVFLSMLKEFQCQAS